MKILIYSANFAPEPTGIGKYSGEMAEWFAKQGHEVRVVAAKPHYPAWSVSEGYRWPLYQTESWKGCRVWRAPLWVPKSPGGLKRVLHLLSFAISSTPIMMRQWHWKADIVLTVAPSFVCSPMAWLTAKVTGASSWIHIQDFEVDVAFTMGLLKGGFSRKIISAVERSILQRFDVASTISARMLDLLKSKGVSANKCKLFPNWVDTNKIKPLTLESPYKSELHIPKNSVVALFSGTLSKKQGLMVIPAAAELLIDRPEIQFVICGDGPMKSQLELSCVNLSNVRLLPLQDSSRLSELLGLADIHLLPQSPDAEDLVLPSKLTGMLSSGKPIIATCNLHTEIGSVVSNCGVVVPPNDAHALAKAITNLAGNASLREKLGTSARKFAVDQIGQEAVLEKLLVDMLALRDGHLQYSNRTS